MAQIPLDIRPLEPEDWDALGEVYRAASLVEMKLSGRDPASFKPLTEEEDPETFALTSSAIVAWVDRRRVGFAAWRDRGEWEGGGYLSFLYVHPDWHRRGIGDQLLKRALEALGPQAWTLTPAGNLPAIKLYQKHGMQIVKAPAPGNTHCNVRLALPTSRKSDPCVPDFGIGT